MFINRSQMTSKCTKNKNVVHKSQASVSLMFLQHPDVFCDLLLNSLRAKWNLFVLYHEQKRKQRQIKLSSYRFTAVWGFVPVRLDIFQVTNATLCLYLFFSSLSLSFFQGLSEWARTSKRRTGCLLLAWLHRATNLGNIHLQPVRH